MTRNTKSSFTSVVVNKALLECSLIHLHTVYDYFQATVAGLSKLKAFTCKAENLLFGPIQKKFANSYTTQPTELWYVIVLIHTYFPLHQIENFKNAYSGVSFNKLVFLTSLWT